MATAEQMAELFARLKALDDFATNNKLPPSPTREHSIGKATIGMDVCVKTVIDDPPVKVSGLRASMYSELSGSMDEKINTAMSMSTGGGTQSNDAWWKSVLESKAIQEIGPVVDAQQYRCWDKMMNNALEQVRPIARQTLDTVEKLPEEELISAKQLGPLDSYKDAIIAATSSKTGNSDLTDLLVLMWTCGRSSAPRPKEKRRKSSRAATREKNSGLISVSICGSQGPQTRAAACGG